MKSSSHLCWVEFMLNARDKRHHSSFFYGQFLTWAHHVCVHVCRNSWSYQDSFIRNDSPGHRNVPSRPRTLPFAAVGNAYTNISLNAPKNLDEESPMNQESGFSESWLFFFPSSSNYSPALTNTRAVFAKTDRFMLRETIVNGFVQLATEIFPSLRNCDISHDNFQTLFFRWPYTFRLKKILEDVENSEARNC